MDTKSKVDRNITPTQLAETVLHVKLAELQVKEVGEKQADR